MIHLASLTDLVDFFFAPRGSPWYTGNVYGNVVAILPCGVLGYLWSKTRFWPLRSIRYELRALHKKSDAHRESLDALHEKIDRLDRHSS